MTTEDAGAEPSPPTPPAGAVDDEETLRHLIRAAFEAARKSGRTDWQQMNVAVLKNRLLAATNGAFKETDYGVRSISDLVRRLPDLLVFDGTGPQPVARLLPSHESMNPPVVSEGARIRRDLWNAVMDYRNGAHYVWDGVLAQRADSLSPDELKTALMMPAMNDEEMDVWRSEFLAANNTIIERDPSAIELAHQWRIERLRTMKLPGELQGRWNTELKQRVIGRLTQWFADKGISPPSDLLQPTRQGGSRDSSAISTNAIRELVLRCVRVMTDKELRDLKLPAAAVLRAGR